MPRVFIALCGSLMLIAVIAGGVACSSAPCADCPALVLLYPQIPAKPPSAGAMSLDFSFPDKEHWFLIYKTDADFVRSGIATKIIPRKGHNQRATITTPTASLSTTPDGKAFRLDNFRIFINLRRDHVDNLGRNSLTIRLQSFGETFHIYNRNTFTISFVDTTKINFRLESALWLGKPPDKLICVDKTLPKLVRFSSTPSEALAVELAWKGTCP